ncbi:unnamed protein product [Prunus brigantina]
MLLAQTAAWAGFTCGLAWVGGPHTLPRLALVHWSHHAGLSPLLPELPLARGSALIYVIVASQVYA